MIIAVVVVSVPFYVVVAAEFEGTVSAVDDKGMATVKATDGKEYKASDSWGEGRETRWIVMSRGERHPATSSARHTNNTLGEARQPEDDRQARCVAPRRAWYVYVRIPDASLGLGTCHLSPKDRGSTGAVVRASL